MTDKVSAHTLLTDKHGRRITDLRISVTDRCNYRCVYCRTGNDGALFAELPSEDYLRMARVFVSLGITKIRLTGGEPLLRRELPELVGELARLRTVQGDELDLAITTNGHLLQKLAGPLAAAGLKRVTVSMDAVDRERFARITRVSNGFDKVLAGIRAAKEANLGPVKINCVLLRGFNDDQITEFGRFAREENVVVRFIEFMPLEEDRVWSPQIVVPLKEILQRMASFRPLREIEHGASETARRYVFDDGVGEIGIIAPVSMPFCGHCSRVRLTSDGKIRTCLFSVIEHDLYGLMRRGVSDERLSQFIIEAISQKEERHHIGEPGFVPPCRRSEDKVPRHWSYSHICQKRADMGHRRTTPTSAKSGQIWGTERLTYESCNEPAGSCIIRAELSPGFNNPAGGARWASHHGSAPAEANGSFQHPRSAALRN